MEGEGAWEEDEDVEKEKEKEKEKEGEEEKEEEEKGRIRTLHVGVWRDHDSSGLKSFFAFPRDATESSEDSELRQLFLLNSRQKPKKNTRGLATARPQKKNSQVRFSKNKFSKFFS
jgi:hypothetical protein